MPEQLGSERAAQIGRDSTSVRSQLQRITARLHTRYRLARKVFLGDDGRPTAAAEEWLRRLAADNYVLSTTYTGDRDRMLKNEGRRELALEILNSTRFDAARLAALTRMEREFND